MQFILRCLPTRIKDEHIDKERLPGFISLEELREYIIQDLIKNKDKKKRTYKVAKRMKKVVFTTGEPIECSRCKEQKVFNSDNFYIFKGKQKRVCKDCSKLESKMYASIRRGVKCQQKELTC